MGDVNFTLIPAGIIERIEIIRFGRAAVYGTGAFGGELLTL
jgi:outer membrane cobalamin receptor